MGVNNEAIQQHMISLFGETGLKQLQKDCAGASPAEREMIVSQALCDSLKQNGSKFVLPFRFKNEQGNRTSHHLIFLSKSFRGYDIMKDIMYSESSQKIGNVASFEYNPRDVNFRQGSVFDLLSRPLDELSDMLQNTYAGKCIDFRTLYEEHSVDTPYVRKNYKDALKALYETGKINAVNAKTGKLPKKGTFSDDMRITFKARK